MKSGQFFAGSRIVLLQLFFSIVLSGNAAAESRLKDLSADEREKLIRKSIFAPDNPEYSISASLQNSSGLPNSTGQFGDPEPRAPAGQTGGKPTGSSSRHYSQKRNSQFQRHQPDPEPEAAVELNENGSVRVQTGNNSIDRSVESFIDKKVRGAQNVLRNLWR